MKVKYNEKEILTLNETKRKVFLHEMLEEGFDEDIERRLQWVLTHKYEQCMKRLRDEWVPKFRLKGLATIPLDDDQLAELIFSQAEYQSRSKRDKEE